MLLSDATFIYETSFRLEELMKNTSLLKVGLVGTSISALYCFTPILVVFLGAVGLSSLLGVLDYFLLPILGSFLILTGYALWKRRRQT